MLPVLAIAVFSLVLVRAEIQEVQQTCFEKEQSKGEMPNIEPDVTE
jgi:hypothetical protein